HPPEATDSTTLRNHQGILRELLDLQRIREPDGLSVADAQSLQYRLPVRIPPCLVAQSSHIDGAVRSVRFQCDALPPGHARHGFHPYSDKIPLAVHRSVRTRRSHRK